MAERARPVRILIGLVLAVFLAGAAFYFFRGEPAIAPPATIETARAPEPAHSPETSAPRQPAPATEVRKGTSNSDPFEFVRALAKSAFDGDGRAQFLIGRELDKCEMTLSLVRKSPHDPETTLWNLPDSWTPVMKERAIAEYRRCARLLTEDPFAELPPRKGGYPFQYWKHRASQTDYPLAVAEKTLNSLLRPAADARDLPKLSVESLHELTKAAASGDPDVALTIGVRQSWGEDSVHGLAGPAWMLAACRLGGDCGADSKVFPMFMCYEPNYPNCDKDFDVQLMLSTGLSPERYAAAYAQSQVIEEALRSRDPAVIQPLLERIFR